MTDSVIEWDGTHRPAEMKEKWNLKKIGPDVTGAFSANFIILENDKRTTVVWLQISSIVKLTEVKTGSECFIQTVDGEFYTCNNSLVEVATEIDVSTEAYVTKWEETRLKK